jgi:hypothetical protein
LSALWQSSERGGERRGVGRHGGACCCGRGKRSLLLARCARRAVCRCAWKKTQGKPAGDVWRHGWEKFLLPVEKKGATEREDARNASALRNRGRRKTTAAG